MLRLFGKGVPLASRAISKQAVLSQRLLSTSFPRLNELKEEPTPKKKPLSRIPIGGSTTQQQKLKESNLEFASWKAALLLAAVGGGLWYFFTNEKKRLQVQQDAESNRGYGKPLIGGPFNLLDTDGEPFTEQNLKGQFSIVYFGFTHCPDICPDELDKLGSWLDQLKKEGYKLQPIFITCDPARDSPEVIKEYLTDFHPDIVGLTGTYDEVKNTCKQYRVYFSTPPNVKPGQDYLVDHSIFFYLMDSDGEFVDALGRNYDNETGPLRIKEQIDTFIPKADREKKKQGWSLW
jgi:protein SCO1/2